MSTPPSSSASPPPQTFKVSCSLGDDVFWLRSLKMTETLGQPFVIELELGAETADININDLLGKQMCVSMTYGASTTPRYFSGHVIRMGFVTASQLAAVYHAVLRPWLWLLSYTNDCQIFQNTKINDLIKTEFFAAKAIEDKLDANVYKLREYVVQYRESDFNFVSRLMEEEGIFYYFKHTENKHTMVLCDSKSGLSTVAGSDKVSYLPGRRETYDRDAISDWHGIQEVETAQYLHTNFDFAKPSTNLLGKSATLAAGYAGVSVFDYPGVHLEVADGDRFAKMRLEELQVPHETYTGYGTARGLGAGNTFKLEEHPRSALNQEYLIVSAEIQASPSGTDFGDRGQDTDFRFESKLTAIPSSRPFRAPRITRKPTIPGPQTAIVVGPSGDEIYTDKYGRVKLKFHWDRLSKSDENSSCFVRVSSALAGKNWGHIFLPRIGQEVIVEFLEGDPDRPIITGRVYNGDLMPPYTLPDDMTKSTMKSRSTKEGTADTFNELRFQDLKGSEEVYFHAEKDFNRVVENNDTLKVGFEKKDKGDQTLSIYHDRSLTVGNNETIKIGDGEGLEKGDQSVTIYHNRTLTIGNNDVIKIGDGKGKEDGNQTITIYKDRTTELTTGNDSLTVKAGNSTTTVNKDRTITVETGNDSLKISAGTQTTEAAQSITLKVGGSKIVIDNQGITLTAPQIKITGNATAEMSSPMTKVVGSGMLTLQGALTKIN